MIPLLVGYSVDVAPDLRRIFMKIVSCNLNETSSPDLKNRKFNSNSLFTFQSFSVCMRLRFYERLENSLALRDNLNRGPHWKPRTSSIAGSGDIEASTFAPSPCHQCNSIDCLIFSTKSRRISPHSIKHDPTRHWNLEQVSCLRIRLRTLPITTGPRSQA